MNRFTRAMLRHLLRDPGTKLTCKEWLDAEPDRDERIAKFSMALREDLFKDAMPLADRRDGYNELIRELLYEGLMRINWLQVAAELVERFTPKRLAGYVHTPSIN